MRKWFAPLAAAALVVALSAPAAAAAPVRVEVAGHELVSDVAPYLESGRTMVPLRALASQLGFDVTWEPEAQKVLVSKWPKTVELTIGSDTAVVNGREVKLDAPAQLVSDRTMVPLRFVSECLGAQVSWDQETWTASVQPPGPQVEQAWELLRKSQENQVAGVMGTGEMTMDWSFQNVPQGVELPSMPSVSMTMAFQSLGKDALITSEATMDGETITTQAAVYQDQIWVNLPDEGWIQFGDESLSEIISNLGLPGGFPLDLDAAAELNRQFLADGQATVIAQENLDGVNTFVVRLDLSNSPFLTDLLTMSGEAVEGAVDVTLDRFLVYYWLDENGFARKSMVTMAMSMPLIPGQEGPVMVSSATGRFLFQPSDEAVQFPPEITGQSGSTPTEEEPTEVSPAEEPAEQQPAEEASAAEEASQESVPEESAEEPAVEEQSVIEAPVEAPVQEAPAA